MWTFVLVARAIEVWLLTGLLELMILISHMEKAHDLWSIHVYVSVHWSELVRSSFIDCHLPIPICLTNVSLTYESLPTITDSCQEKEKKPCPFGRIPWILILLVWIVNSLATDVTVLLTTFLGANFIRGFDLALIGFPLSTMKLIDSQESFDACIIKTM